MEILFELSQLLFEDAETLDGKTEEYRDLKRLESQLLDKLPDELHERLNDVQAEIEPHILMNSFLYGVQLGFAASHLGQGG